MTAEMDDACRGDCTSDSVSSGGEILVGGSTRAHDPDRASGGAQEDGNGCVWLIGCEIVDRISSTCIWLPLVHMDSRRRSPGLAPD